MHRKALAVGLATILATLHATIPARADPTPSTATTDDSAGPHWLFPTIVMGVGAVLATSGIVYYLTANQHYPEALGFGLTRELDGAAELLAFFARH